MNARIFLLALLVLCCGARAQVIYTPSDAIIANPERGWMWTNQPFCPGTTSIDFIDFETLRASGVTLVDQVYILDDFRDAPLSQQFLDGFANDCERLRQEGMKLVPRFAYNWIESCTGADDASLARTLEHMEQLQPLFRENADAIALFQVSFVGRYGEMHSSTSGHVLAGSTLLAASGTQIVQKLLDTIPVSRSWCLRYPKQRIQLFPDPLDASDAFTTSRDARTGFANHGFATSADDYGTWDGVPSVREAEKAYAEAVSLFVPQIGEPGGAIFDGEALTPEEALAEIQRFHYDIMVMNQGDAIATGVYDAWRDAGVYDELSKRLGYRFRLVGGKLDTPVASKRIALRLAISNDGFSSPINPRGALLVLRHIKTGAVYRLRSGIDDIRSGFPAPGETKVVEFNARVPAVVAAGQYDVLLALPDPHERLRDRAAYAIRCANIGVWDADAGANDLRMRVLIDPRHRTHRIQEHHRVPIGTDSPIPKPRTNHPARDAPKRPDPDPSR